MLLFCGLACCPDPFHSAYRTDGKAVSAMQAVGGVNVSWDCTADTIHRANAPAALAADTFFRNNAIAVFLNTLTAEGKTLAIGRKLGKVEIFALTFVELKHFQSLPAFFGGIDFRHIGVLFKDFS